MPNSKAQLRAAMRKRKRAMTESEIQHKSAQLARMFFETEQYRKARSIYGYLSCNQEVRILPILERALRDGKRIAVPKCYGDEMKFIWLEDLTAVALDSRGIPQPVADGPEADDETALVLLPGLAFDREGNRLGYGGGYYDRFLQREPGHPTVALCYDFQLVDRLETDEHDIPADLVLRA